MRYPVMARRNPPPSPFTKGGGTGGGREITALFGMGLTVLLLVATRSVAAWIGVLGGLFFLTTKQGPKKWGLICLMVIGGCLVFKASQPQVLDRLVWWQAAIALWKNHPLIGAGLGSTEILLPQLQMAGLFSQYPHSLPLQLAAEIGLLGVGAFGLVVYRFFKHSSSLSSRLAVGGLLITNCFDYSFLLPGISLPFWFLLGDAYGVIPAQARMQSHDVQGSQRKFFNGPLIGGILLATSASLVAVVKPFLASRHLAMGQYLLGKGQLDQAERTFKTAVDRDSLDPIPYTALAETYVRRFQQEGSPSWLDEAILAQEQAVHRQPQQASGWAALAQLHRLHGEIPAARQALREAIRLAPARTEYQRLLASLRKREKR
ncbi:MAG: O-antigen ligase family protein [Elusimicrobia bacterium]|nr:O-antigen ligase family protein [Elusimicrobiota bacterium]